MARIRSTDEVGKIYGHLHVEMRLPSKHGKAMWLCQCRAPGCKAGHRKVSGTDLRNGTATHCGCLTPREHHTVLTLAARVEALEQRLSMLFSGGPPLRVGHGPSILGKLSEPQPPEQPAPASELPANLPKQPAMLLPGPLDAQPGETPEELLERLLSIPFDERHPPHNDFRELKARAEEAHRKVLIELRAAEDDNPFIQMDNPAHKRRRDISFEATKRIKAYHLDPRKDL